MEKSSPCTIHSAEALQMTPKKSLKNERKNVVFKPTGLNASEQWPAVPMSKCNTHLVTFLEDGVFSDNFGLKEPWIIYIYVYSYTLR
jgi:hypothetical protein